QAGTTAARALYLSVGRRRCRQNLFRGKRFWYVVRSLPTPPCPSRKRVSRSACQNFLATGSFSSLDSRSKVNFERALLNHDFLDQRGEFLFPHRHIAPFPLFFERLEYFIECFSG